MLNEIDQFQKAFSMTWRCNNTINGVILCIKQKWLLCQATVLNLRKQKMISTERHLLINWLRD